MKTFSRLMNDDEDSVEYFINGIYIANASYDEHGSAGMKLADQIFHNIATQFGQEVEPIFEGGE